MSEHVVHVDISLTKSMQRRYVKPLSIIKNAINIPDRLTVFITRNNCFHIEPDLDKQLRRQSEI